MELSPVDGFVASLVPLLPHCGFEKNVLPLKACGPAGIIARSGQRPHYGPWWIAGCYRMRSMRRARHRFPSHPSRCSRFRLRLSAKKHPRRKPITRVLNFFRKHQHRMRYAEVHTRGMPIGSGAVESSNKVLIKSRMKGAGMRWSENGTGQPILTFRALWKSGRFGAAWRQISRALEPPEFEFRSRKRHNILKMAN